MEQFFKYSKELLFICDSKGKFIKLNPEWENILGYKVSELEGISCYELIHPNDIKQTKRIIENTIGREEESNFVNRYKHKDGTYRWIRWHCFAYMGKIFASAKDIVKENQPNKNFDQSQAIISSTIEILDDGILIVSSNGEVLHCNTRFKEIFDISEDLTACKDYNLLLKTAKNKFKNPKKFLHEIKSINSSSDIIKDQIYFNDGTILERHSYPLIENSPIKGRVWIFRDITERKKVENALHLTQFTIDNSLDNHIWLDEDARIVYANNASCLSLGYTHDELIGMQVYDFDPDFFPEQWQQYKKRLLKEKQFVFQSRHIRKDGYIFPVEITSNYIEYQGRFLACTYDRDITMSKKNEENLLIFKTSVEHSMEAVYWLDRESNIVYVNKQACNMLGYSKEEFLKMTVYDIDPVFLKSRWEENWVEHISSGRVYGDVIETCHKRKDGFVFPVEVVTNYIKLAELDLQVAHVRDVIDRKEYEESLLQNQKLLTESQRIAQIGSWEMNLEDKTVYWNDATYKICGIEKKEEKISEDFFLSIIHPDDRELARSLIFETVDNEHVKNKEFRIIHPSGEIKNIQVSSELLKDSNGKIIKLIGVVQDVTERKNAEINLRKRQIQLLNAVTMAKIGYWEYDVKKDLFTFNDYFYDVYRTTADDVEGYQLSSSQYAKRFVHPDDVYLIAQEINKAIITDDPDYIAYMEYRILFPNRKTGYIAVRFTIIKDEKGNTITIIGTNQDITERKQAESELIKAKVKAEESEYFLKESQRTGNIGSYKLDFKTGIFHTTETLDNILGIDNTYQKNVKGWFELIHPEDRSAVDNYFYNDVIGNHQPFNMEYRVLRKNDGISRWVHGIGKLYFDKNDKLIQMLGTVLDITERKQNEEALEKRVIALTRPLEDIKSVEFTDLFNLQELQELQDAFSNATGVASIITKPDGTPITKPSNFCSLCKLIRSTKKGLVNCIRSDAFIGKQNEKGYTMQPCISGGLWDTGASITLGGKHVGNWLIGQVRNDALNEDEMIKYADTIGVNRKIYKEELLKVPKMSIEQYKKVSKSLYILSNELSMKAYQNVQQARFITEQKKAEEEIRRLNAKLEVRVKERTQQLEQANMDLESFAYSVSHDLRAPIRHIDGFVNLLSKTLKSSDKKIINYLDKISISSKNMSTMIDELLKFSRQGRADLKIKDVNLDKIIKDILYQFKPDYEGRNIQWNIEQLPVLYGDPGLLKIVFENLISNAIKYTSKKKQAIIEIGRFKNCKPGKNCIYVKDNGAGFNMQYKEKLFGVFQRLHRSEEFEGTGIGLANVKQIIQKHNGSVDVESEINKGATFYITLPKK